MSYADILYRISIINLLFVIAFALFDINMYDNYIEYIKNYIFTIIKNFHLIFNMFEIF